MRQFDLYENPVSAMREAVPLVVVLSSHHATGLTEAIVAPVLRGRTLPVSAFEIPLNRDEDILLISMTGMTAVRETDLRHRVGSAIAYEDAIRRALDRLFTGF
ncbi:CcdB family protein [Caulobacter sp.]|uniref:CcdB family protein n=1 Tax=Caulobacter sp. TaxID=78 RepID=UPI002B48B21B|nr:CcdB family protein [Caulobacter sp.]HJV40860.1 CcdB family protein [Caulobacter sp.]